MDEKGKDPTINLVRRIRPVLVNPDESDVFWACYTEKIDLAKRIAQTHPSLVIYTITNWGDENWVHRGLRTVNRMGYLFGTEDLGPDYAELLWIDQDESLDE